MAGLDEVLERLVTDADFRARLAADPVAALSGYMLYDEDLEVLAATLSEERGASGAVEQRTSKTTLAGLLAAFEGTTGAAGRGIDIAAVDGEPAAAAEGGVRQQLQFEMSSQNNIAFAPGDEGPEPAALDAAATGGAETQPSYFDGKLLRADDLTSERSAPEPEPIQVEMKPVLITNYSLGGGQAEPGSHEDEIEIYGVDYPMTPSADSDEEDPGAGEPAEG